MTATFTLRKSDIARVIRTLNAVDKELMKSMRKEFRTEIRPFANELKSNIPGPSPLSGFSQGTRKARTTTPAKRRSPYVWKKPSASIDIGSRSRGRRRGRYKTEPIVRIVFTDKRPFSAFSVMETARQAKSWRGENMIRGLEKKGYGPVGKGRWVIEQFYSNQGKTVRIAIGILNKYARLVNIKIARLDRFR